MVDYKKVNYDINEFILERGIQWRWFFLQICKKKYIKAIEVFFLLSFFLIFNLIKKYFRIKNEFTEISRILIKYFYEIIN